MRRLRRLARDERGAVAIVFALSAAALVMLLALAGDAGRAYLRSQQLQSGTDLAAIAGAQALDRASQVAGQALSENALADVVLTDVTPGRYQPDPELDPQDRFVANQTPFNALRLGTRLHVPFFFAPAVSGLDGVDLQSVAIAANTEQAAFSIGSRLVGVNGGLANKVLGGLAGGTLSLTVMDYDALAATDLDLFATLDRLAINIGATGLTYDELLTGSVRVGDVLTAAIDTLQANPGGATQQRAASALQTLKSRLSNSLPQIALGNLAGAGLFGDLAVGSGGPGMAVKVAAYNLATGALGLANGSHQIDFDLGLNVPGLASAQANLLIGEPVQGSSWARVGEVGSTLHTAQTRLLITLRLLNVLPGVAEIRVPLYLELASGDARLAAIDCDAASGQPKVTVAARGGAADFWIGNVTPALMQNFSQPVQPGPASLVNLLLLKVTGQSHVHVAAPGYTSLGFTQSQIDQGTVRTTSASQVTQNVVRALVDDLTLQVTIVGLGIGLSSSLIKSTIKAALIPVATALDPVLDNLLDLLGIKIGEVDVRVLGVGCRGAVLVY